MKMSKKTLFVLMGLAVVLLVLVSPSFHKPALDDKKQNGTAAQTKYHCAMHPAIVSDKPGDCPICGMRLVPFQASAETRKEPEKKLLFYRHPMKPGVTSPVPAKDEMGMDYIPVYKGEIGSQVPVPGQAVVAITPER